MADEKSSEKVLAVISCSGKTQLYGDVSEALTDKKAIWDFGLNRLIKLFPVSAQIEGGFEAFLASSETAEQIFIALDDSELLPRFLKTFTNHKTKLACLWLTTQKKASLTDAAADDLVRLIKTCKSLRKIDLGGLTCQPVTYAKIIEAIKSNDSIRIVTLRCQWSAADQLQGWRCPNEATIQTLLNNDSISELTLNAAGAVLTDRDGLAMAAALRVNTMLERFIIHSPFPPGSSLWPGFGASVGAAIAKALKRNPALQVLEMDMSSFERPDLEEIAVALNNNHGSDQDLSLPSAPIAPIASTRTVAFGAIASMLPVPEKSAGITSVMP